jgi:hypothetical protein
MSRIELTDSAMSIMVKLSEGNPGAATALVAMVKDGEKIDPQSSFGAFGGPLNLDTFGIYGPRIWMLYSDVCGKDVTKTLGLLRSVQMGKLTRESLDHAIDNWGEGLDVADILVQVKEALPEFGKVELP